MVSWPKTASNQAHARRDRGELVDTAQLTEVATGYGAFVVVEAAPQFAGHVLIDLRISGCDVLVGTSRKYLRGPSGLGFFAVSERVLDWRPLLLVGRGVKSWPSRDAPTRRRDAARSESHERPLLLELGLAAAAGSVRNAGVASVLARVRAFVTDLATELGGLPGVNVHEQAPETGIPTLSVV